MANTPLERRGREVPRIHTPPLRELTPATSLGFAVIEFCDQVLGFTLHPWQKWLLIHGLELLPDGTFRFRTVVVLVARQNGKSTLSIVLSLFCMYVMARPLVIGTAQDLDVAEEIWQDATDLALEVPELAEHVDQVSKVNGKKFLKLRSGERYKVKAANRRAGRGLSGDLIMLDELREHQSWEAWGAITKTTMAREHAQVWAFSNAGDASSIVLRYLRQAAHANLGDPDGVNADIDPTSLLPTDDDELETPDDERTLGIFEWSTPPGCATDDRDGWTYANPSLGYTITERSIASAVEIDPEWVFRTEVLCQWSDGSVEGPFPPSTWEEGHDPTSEVAESSPMAVCVDVSHDRSVSYVAVAGYRPDGFPHVEVIEQRAGTSWVPGWFTDRPERIDLGPVTFQARGAPVSSLSDPLSEVENLRVVEWSGASLGAACGAFYDAVAGESGERVYHRPQPVLDIAAATANTRPLGDSWVWDRKRSPTDIAPLVAVTGALWALRTQQTPPVTSAYDDADLMVV